MEHFLQVSRVVGLLYRGFLVERVVRRWQLALVDRGFFDWFGFGVGFGIGEGEIGQFRVSFGGFGGAAE